MLRTGGTTTVTTRSKTRGKFGTSLHDARARLLANHTLACANELKPKRRKPRSTRRTATPIVMRSSSTGSGLPIAFQFALPHILEPLRAWEVCGFPPQPGQSSQLPPCVTHWTALIASCVSLIVTGFLLVSTKHELWSLQPARLLGAHVVADMLQVLAAAVIAGAIVETQAVLAF
jgi:hypothetical protein